MAIKFTWQFFVERNSFSIKLLKNVPKCCPMNLLKLVFPTHFAGKKILRISEIVFHCSFASLNAVLKIRLQFQRHFTA